MKNPIVYALERFYGVSDRTAAGLQHSLERDAELHLQGDLACSAEPSPAQLRRFAIDSMAAMDQLRRFGAIDALVEELSGRQTWLWPFFPKPFSEPEQLQLADRSQVQDRCATAARYCTRIGRSPPTRRRCGAGPRHWGPNGRCAQLHAL